MSNPPRVLSIGQCSFDHGTISRYLNKHYAAETTSAASADDAVEELRSKRFDLVLVNRVIDYDRSSGLSIIQSLLDDPNRADAPIMLVSDLADAQAEAVSIGAVDGFGKSEIASDKAKAKLDSVLPATR